MRYFLHLGFDGTSYSGWQRQKNTSNTVQEIIERTLAKILKQSITVHGCGRTDTGVHASQYVMHIDLDAPPSFDLKFRLNKNLPDDIAVFEVLPVTEDRHSRYDATARTYEYFIHWRKDPVLIRHSSFYEGLNVDIDRMRQAAAYLLQTEDFRPLCKRPDLYHNTRCQVTRCELFLNEEQGRLRFVITSNRFLRGMVRYCVSFLLQVGTGHLTPDTFQKILTQEVVLSHKRPALPNGLFLSRVEYPFLALEHSHRLIEMLRKGLGE